MGTLALDQFSARYVMGRNFIGPEEVARFLGLSQFDERLKGLERIPYEEEVLRMCRETHILVAGFPLTILDICKFFPRCVILPSPEKRIGHWSNDRFARKDKLARRWYLMRKEVFNGSLGGSLRAALEASQNEGEELPRPGEFIYAVVLYYALTGERLFENVYAFCQDPANNGLHVRIGMFGSGGLCLDQFYYYRDGLFQDTGIASSRKLPGKGDVWPGSAP